MSFDYGYSPRIKGKGFCPNPVSKYGVPAFADSQTNKKVIGTTAWRDWWFEQFDRCVTGYHTGGLWIPGRYYWYLNFCKISTPGRGPHLPDYCDFDQYFFEQVEEAKQNYEGLIILKRRRGGASERLFKGIMGHGMYFTPDKYQAGIVAGLQDYVDDARMKFRELNAYLPPELRLRFKLSDNDSEIKAGWYDETQEMRGSFNTVFSRTMFNNPNVMKGKFLNDCGFEEAGEFQNLFRGYSATDACFKVGMDNVGTPFVQGTIGKLGKSMQDFLGMWDDVHVYKLRKIKLWGYRIFTGCYVGSRGIDGRLKEDTPNIDKLQIEKKLSREQLLGCEDVKRADDIILQVRQLLATGKNKEKYWENFLDFPRDENEARLRFQNNDFDNDALNNQRIFLTSRATQFYGEYIIDFVKDHEGNYIKPWVTYLRPIGIDDDERQAIYVRHGFEHITTTLKFWGVCGIDGYDQDKSNTSKSLGAVVGMTRKGHNFLGLNGIRCPDKRIPFVMYCNRPHRKEIFYSIALKIAIHWNFEMGCLVDASKPGVIEYFKNNGGVKFLAPRPRNFEDIGTTQSHDFGMIINRGQKSKPQMISVAQSWVVDELDECPFPQIVNAFSNYDIEQIDSDWDDADATMLALVRDVDWKLKLRDDKPDDKIKPMQEWVHNENTGNFELKTVVRKPKAKEDANRARDPFMDMLESGKFR